MREVWSSRARLLFEVKLKAKKQGRFTLVVHTQAIVTNIYTMLFSTANDYLCPVKKIVAFILAIIVAVAAYTPCCMVDDCHDEPITKQETPKESKAASACSPFFACASCNGFVPAEQVVTLTKPEVFFPKYNLSNFGFTTPAFAAFNWQPPRLS